MPAKKDSDATPGMKLLRLFRKLMLDGRRHFQLDLAKELQCSPQTIIRMVAEIESVIGAHLESGLDMRRRWYQIRTISRNRLGLEFEELRYLSICRDLAASSLPEQVARRVDETIFSLSLLMADQAYACRDKVQDRQFAFFPKGKIDYTPHYHTIEQLVSARDERRICRIIYKALGRRETKEYLFAPGRIVAMSGALYILGALTDESGKNILRLNNFAIHRISTLEVSEIQFDFPLPEASAGTFGLPWHEPKTFRIRFAPGSAADYVREKVWADEQHMQELEDGGVLLEITTCSEPELMSWVRSFGDAATLQPL